MAWYMVQSNYFFTWIQFLGFSVLILSILSGLLCWCVVCLRYHLSHESSNWKRATIVLSCVVALWVLTFSWSAFVLLRFFIDHI